MQKSHMRFARASFIGAERHLSVHRRPLSDTALHAHDYFEIEIILEGDGRQILNGAENPLVRGSISVLTPADFHQIEKGNTPSDSWNIAFDETILPPLYLEPLYGAKAPFRILSEALLQKVVQAASLLMQEEENERSARPLLEYLLSLLFTPAEDASSPSPMGKALLFIENHFREDPSLADAANEAHLSAGYFGALFKKTTGETYIHYLNHRKVHCAEMLLKNGMSVAEACFASGFGSLSGFLHTFKKFKGVAPEAIKKREGSP